MRHSLARLLLAVASAATFTSGPALAQTKSSTSTISPTGTKSLTVAPDSGGGGCGANMICVTPGPTPSPTPTPGSSQVLVGPDKTAFNYAVAMLEGGAGGGSVGFASLQNSGTSMFASFTGGLALDAEGLLVNPLSAFLTAPGVRASSRAASSDAQTFSCGSAKQFVWVGGPAMPLAPDYVGYCRTRGDCQAGGPAPGLFYGVYDKSYGNDIAPLSCSDVRVVGGAYKNFGSNPAKQIKNAFAWRSFGAPTVRYLSQHVGCIYSNPSEMAGPNCAGSCGIPGAACSASRFRSAEALAISANGLNISGEGYVSGAGDYIFFGGNVPRVGFLWRGIFNYPANGSDLQALSSSLVSPSGVSDSLQLYSAWTSNPSGVGTNYSLARGMYVLGNQPGSGEMKLVGTMAQASGLSAPSNRGAEWVFQDLGDRIIQSAEPLAGAMVSEFSDINEVVPSNPNPPGLLAAASKWVSATEALSMTKDVIEDSAAPNDLGPVSFRFDCQLEGFCDSPVRKYGATASSELSEFVVGQVHNGIPLEASPPANGGTPLGQSYFYGFYQGYPAVWAPGKQAVAIEMPLDSAGGVAWDVAAYSSDKAIVVGTYLSTTLNLPQAFVSACKIGTSSICCRPAQRLSDYLYQKGVAVGANTSILSAHAVQMLGDVAYFTGSAKYSSTSNAQAFAAKLTYGGEFTCQAQDDLACD